MLNNYNNLHTVPTYSLRGILSAPKGLIVIYDHQSFVQIAEGLMLITKFTFNDDESPQSDSFPLLNSESQHKDIVVTANGNIVTLSVDTMGTYQLVVYVDGEATRRKLQTKANNFIKSYKCDNEICYIFQGQEPQYYNEVVWFQSSLKRINATGILPERIIYCNMEYQQLNILMKSTIQSFFAEGKCLCLSESVSVKNGDIGFLKVSDKFVYYSATKIRIIQEQKVIQTINLAKIINILPVTLGFIVLTGVSVIHFQRRGDVFNQMDTFSLTSEYKTIQMTKKQDLLLLQNELGVTDILQININRIDQNDNSKTFGRKCTIRNQQKHISIVATSADSNPFLIVIKEAENQMVIFSKVSLQKILVYNFEGSPIYDCKLQSNRPYFTISIAGVLRRYSIVCDHIQESHQINLRARKIIYSPSNQHIGCIVGSSNFSKIQIVLSDDLKQLCTLWVGQQIVDIVWSDHSLDVYAIVQKGYERWSVLDSFNSKKKFKSDNKILSAGYSKTKSALVLFMNDMCLRIVKDQQVMNTLKIQDNIKSVVINNNLLFMANMNGILSYNFLDSKSSPIQLKLFSSEFDIFTNNSNQIVCLSSSKTSLFVLKPEYKKGEQAKISLQQKDITYVERTFIKQLKNKDKLYQQKSSNVYTQMQQTVKQIQKRYQATIENQKKEFSHQIKQVQNTLEEEVQNNKNLQREVRQNKQKYQIQQLKAIQQLESLYDRKITILTNKLMTESELCSRNQIKSKENIQNLQSSHKKQIIKINEQFERKIKNLQKMDVSEKIKNQKIVKQYEERLAQQYEQSESLSRLLQFQYDEMICNEKRAVIQWQEKHKKCMIQKFNVQEAMNKLKDQNQDLLKKNRKQLESIQFQRKRIVVSNEEISKLSRHIKDLETRLDRQQANSYELSQANQVLGFKILESREIILPKERKLQQLKQKFCSFQIQYQKNLQQISQQSQLIEQLKKQNGFCKKQITSLKDTYQKQHRNFVNLIYQIRQIVTETPTQEWNKKISWVYQDINSRGLFPGDTKNIRRNKKTVVEQIDRAKNHLQICLNQVITSNSKIQKRKSNELLKKLKQNADLLQEINQLRTKLKTYEQMDSVKQSFRRRSISNKSQYHERIRPITQVIQEEKFECEAPHLFESHHGTQKKQHSRGFQSTSVDFRRSTIKKGERTITKNIIRKGGIQLSKIKQKSPSQSEQIQFLYRKIELQDRIILSLRAKLSGLNI